MGRYCPDKEWYGVISHIEVGNVKRTVPLLRVTSATTGMSPGRGQAVFVAKEASQWTYAVDSAIISVSQFVLPSR